MDIAAFLLILGASARLTRLVTHDEITEGLRARAGNGLLGFMLHCPYCIGLWIAAAVTGLYLVVPGMWFTVPAVALGANLVWALTQETLDMVVVLHRERTEALKPPEPSPARGRGARQPTRRGE